MTVINYKNVDVELKQNESVLDGLLRNGFDVPCGCKAGKCQSCLMSVQTSQDPLQPAQKGISETQKSLGFVKSCQFKPMSPSKMLGVDESAKRVYAQVVEKKFINDSVLKLRLKVPFAYKPGQYITLYRNSKIARSYSIASHDQYDEFLEVHIRILQNGEFSNWIKNDVWVGHKIGVQGPSGQCFYKQQKDKPLLLCGTGTGIAPIYGILQDALYNGHKQPIHIIYAAKKYKDLYFIQALKFIAKKHSFVKLHLVTAKTSGTGACKQDVYEYMDEHFKNLQGWGAYICGVESFVKYSKKIISSNGLNLADMYSESFLNFVKENENVK